MKTELWQFVANQKKHTQDGPNLVRLMKSIGRGLRPIKAVDIGCGDGIIAIEMLQLKRASFVTCIDILHDAVTAAESNLKHFTVKSDFEIYRQPARVFFLKRKNWEAYDLMAINPPFFSKGSGARSKCEADWIARHDESLPLSLWSKGACRILKNGGELYCVFPTERLSEALNSLSKAGLEPKELWWFKADLRRRRFFLRCTKGGKPGMKIHFDFE